VAAEARRWLTQHLRTREHQASHKHPHRRPRRAVHSRRFPRWFDTIHKNRRSNEEKRRGISATASVLIRMNSHPTWGAVVWLGGCGCFEVRQRLPLCTGRHREPRRRSRRQHSTAQHRRTSSSNWNHRRRQAVFIYRTPRQGSSPAERANTLTSSILTQVDTQRKKEGKRARGRETEERERE
jgi:hypothetical protein